MEPAVPSTPETADQGSGSAPDAAAQGSGRAPGLVAAPARRRPRWASSLRFRLAASYTLLVAAVLSVLSVVVYTAVRQTMISQTERFLATIAHRVGQEANGKTPAEMSAHLQASITTVNSALDSGPIREANLPIDLRHNLGAMDFSRTAMRVVSAAPDRRVIAQSGTLFKRPHVLHGLDIALTRVQPVSSYQFQVLPVTSVQYLYTVAKRVETPAGAVYIQVGMPWGRDSDLLARLRWLLEACIVMSCLLAYFGGRLLVAYSLRPVDRVVEQVRLATETGLQSAALPTAEGSDEEIGRLIGTFNALVLRLSRSLDAQRRFSQDAAHELQTPASILRLQLESALRRERPASELRAAIESAIEDVARISRIIDALSFTARSSDWDAAAKFAPLDIASLARTTTDAFRPMASAKNIALSLAADRPGNILGDREQIGELIGNLIDNAIKYTEPGGKVDVAVSPQDGGKIVLSVSDTGCGLEPEELQHVFERFWRSERVRSVKGSGLGLAICERIVRSHGGAIHIVRRPEGGSIFTVELPGATGG
jgi:signal transduction histidine kinase